MQERQKILFVLAIVLLGLIALMEGVVLLRNSPYWDGWITGTFHPLAWAKARWTPADNVKGKDDIILQETAEDLERMQNQINRLFYEMTRTAPFTRQNIGQHDRPDRQNPFATLRSKASSLRSTSQPPADIQRLQSEIAHIFQSAHESRHNSVLHLIDQDWDSVGEISSMNMEEDGTNYVVTVSMPGFEQTNINVSLAGRVLTVEAAAEHQQAVQDYRTARSGCFKTQIMLPNDIAGESAQAFYRDGTLKITVPKKPAGNSLARKIKIM